MHFGLGTARTPVSVIVEWPDGTRTRLAQCASTGPHGDADGLAAGLRLAPPRERVERDGEEQDAARRDEDDAGREPEDEEPFAIVAITAAPSTALRMLPRPPKRLVPPITAAEIASRSSVPPPWSGATERTFAASTMPPTPAISPEIMKTRIRIRATLMPARRAASALPPTA